MNQTTARIREAHRDELTLCAQLWSTMRNELNAAPIGLHPDWADRFVTYVERRSRAEELALFVAEADRAIVGTSMGLLIDGWPAPLFERITAGYVYNVYVDPDQRRRGIGLDLLRATVDWLRNRGCTVIRLRASDSGRMLYETLGFVPGIEMELWSDGSG